VQSALARRGDADAARAVEQAARNGSPTCDREDLEVRIEALNALSQLDQGSATPLLRKVLARRDECSAELRRGAVMLIARRGGNDALPLLSDVAANDPSSTVRSMAMTHIAQQPGDAGAAALESLARASDENVRRSALRALMRRDDQRSRRAVRSYLEAPQTTESQKVEIISSYSRENATADDIAFLRTLYGRTDSDRIRSVVLSVLPRIAPEEGRQLLLSIARNPNESTSARAVAISAIGRDATLPVAELVRVFDAANERRIREQVVVALARRSEQEATDKLVDIARNSTDPVVRRTAISQLTQKKDPRLAAILQELIER